MTLILIIVLFIRNDGREITYKIKQVTYVQVQKIKNSLFKNTTPRVVLEMSIIICNVIYFNINVCEIDILYKNTFHQTRCHRNAA